MAFLCSLWSVSLPNWKSDDTCSQPIHFEPGPIDKSVQMLKSWLRSNSGDVALRFGFKARQLEGVITHYQGAHTKGVSMVL